MYILRNILTHAGRCIIITCGVINPQLAMLTIGVYVCASAMYLHTWVRLACYRLVSSMYEKYSACMVVKEKFEQ